MYCKNCGEKIDDRAVVCPHCGVQQTALGITDSGNKGWGVLGFFFPVIGLVLYLVWHDTKPLTAKIAGKGALISVIVCVVFIVLAFVLSLVLAAKVSTSFNDVMKATEAAAYFVPEIARAL